MEGFDKGMWVGEGCSNRREQQKQRPGMAGKQGKLSGPMCQQSKHVRKFGERFKKVNESCRGTCDFPAHQAVSGICCAPTEWAWAVQECIGCQSHPCRRFQ